MEIVLILLAIAGLIVGLSIAVRGSLVVICAIYMPVAVIIGFNFLHFRAGINLSLDRLLLIAICGAFVLQWILGRIHPKPVNRVDIALFALMAVLVASTFYGGFSLREPYTELTSPFYRLLTGYLFPLMLYWIARHSTLDKRQVSTVYATLFALGLYLSFTGLMEVTRQWWAVWPRFIADPEIGVHFGRARGPMLQSVCCGLYIDTAILIAWVWGNRLGKAGRLALWLPAPLLFTGAFFTYTRSVWMGVAAGLMIVLWLTLDRKWRPLVVGAMIAGAVGLVAMKFDDLMGFDRGQDAATVRVSAESRASFAYVSWLMFKDKPLFGYGFGQFPVAKLPYLADRKTDLVLEVIRPDIHHNFFLSMLVDAGIVGLMILMILLVAWWRTAWKLANAANAPPWARLQGVLTCGVFIVWLIQASFHELSYMTEANILMFLMMGLTVNLQQRYMCPAREMRLVTPAANPARLPSIRLWLPWRRPT